ncbi:motile sperm domain-containing protein 2-like protein [Leptotrombidium deliense]|uniref:Motile sperm domain-containing protein 2-like protein n=1 Tax=Leptotrombidium deliense TaxID=299467 RepID=A0A443RT01_9ACAR|nr:motile sperm domain-containing protein 2-like protein [Leptotrombidium deliense]
MKDCVVYQLNKLDLKQARERSWNVLVDATGTGYDNADLHMLLFFFETLRYFPMGIKYYIIYDMPWLLNAFATLILSMIPGFAKDKIKFWDPKELLEHVDENALPDVLGGTCRECYRGVPQGAMDIYYLAKRDFDLDRNEVDRFLQPSLKYIDTENWIEVENV